ncbi:MAG TPA: ROK family protein [Pyrinomonadaceae bacterium]|jgi:predicted NBD/HSP70 family sugar kinase
MTSELHFQSDVSVASLGKGSQMLRLIRAAQPISRVSIASRLKIDPSTVSENVRPLIASGILCEETVVDKAERRRSRMLSFNGDAPYFAGVNLGVRRSQVGLTTLRGEITDEVDFETPPDPYRALSLAREHLEGIVRRDPARRLGFVGVSVPGMTDAARQKLIFAPHLEWRNIEIARAFRIIDTVGVVVENDSTAAALYEARLKIRDTEDGLLTNFILVRSGTGIGVGLVIGGRIYRGNGIAGEFGHMTIVAGGKPCVCGNRGCWEKYASAAAAASLYLGDRPPARGEAVPRFVEIVAKANVGDMRSRRTLEKIGDYLGIGIANVIMGIGIPRVIISGRLVYGWKFIEGSMKEAIKRSMIGIVGGWSVEAGEPVGSAIGGALEVAVEEYLSRI